MRNQTLSGFFQETGLVLRPLSRNDWSKGYGELLAQLTTVGDVSDKDFQVSPPTSDL